MHSKLDNYHYDHQISSSSQDSPPTLRKPKNNNLSSLSRQSTPAKKKWWTKEEDEKLRKLVKDYGPRNWKKIALSFEDRTDVQCLHRW